MQQQRKKMAEQLKASYATEDEEKQFLVYEQKLKQDSTQGHELHRLLENHGWPDQSTYGISATKQVTAVLLHSPPKIQEKCLPILLEAAKNNEASKSDVAQIHDKVLIYQGNKQRYGTQISFNKQKGMNDVHPISDEANVNTRRAAMGLNSIEEYLKSKGIKY